VQNHADIRVMTSRLLRNESKHERFQRNDSASDNSATTRQTFMPSESGSIPGIDNPEITFLQCSTRVRLVNVKWWMCYHLN